LAQQPTPAVAEVLGRIRSNIAAYLGSLPSFSCIEQITSQELRKGQVTLSTQLEADLRVKHAGTPSRADSLTEVQNVQEVDGHPARKNSYKLPLTISGAFGDSFANLFDEQFSSCYDYHLDQSKALDGKPSLILSLTRKSKGAAAPPCDRVAPEASATVWIDPKSFQILSMATRFPEAHQSGFSDLRIYYKYSPVILGGKQFFLPASVTAELSNVKASSALHYEASYSSYHKFDVTVRIVPSPNQNDKEQP
jgi:hypothetical protein